MNSYIAVQSRRSSLTPAIRRTVRSVARALFRRRQSLALVSTILISGMAYALAYVVRFEMHWPAAYTSTFLLTIGWLLAARVAVSFLFRLNVHRWRYTGLRDAMDIVLATMVSSVVFLLVVSRLPISPGVPRSVFLLEWVFASYMLGGLRLAYRLAFEWYQRRLQKSRRPVARRRVLIMGAGEAGSLVSQEMMRYPELGYDLVGFVDDDRAKLRTRLRGISVLGDSEAIPMLVAKNGIDELVLAIPSAPPDACSRIVNICQGVDVGLRILPHERGVLSGPVSLSQLRDVWIEDLLAREPIQLRLQKLEADLRDRPVLITGAAGSIGSELARQVALHRPSVLVLFDQAETDVFYIDLELREAHPALRVVPVVGDILDDARIADVMETYRPARVYHAAAYKHVPLMEANACEAVRNNVIGTWKVAEAAGAAGVEKFVLISTDKAVNPSCMMGTTKRTAELVILSCAERHPETHYTAVRFGNVLGSQGSVIPVFRRQIAEGKPLTVTDPQATRYFITIAEAVQLVLEASLLPEARGQITMLDMGKPVRIMDMARNLLRLAGVTNPDERIRFTGLRPGERLHEVLIFGHEQTSVSAHPKVRLVNRGDEAWKLELLVRLRTLRLQAADGDAEVLDWIWAECCGPAERQALEAEVEGVSGAAVPVGEPA